MTSICLLHAEKDGALAAALRAELHTAQVKSLEFSAANVRGSAACVLLWTRAAAADLQPMIGAAVALQLGKPCLVVTPFGVRAPEPPSFLRRCPRLEAEARFLPEAIAQWLDQQRGRPLIHVPVQAVLLARLARLGRDGAMLLRNQLLQTRPGFNQNSSEVETAQATAPSPELRALVCRVCGSTVRDLRRHAKSAHGLSSEAYRAKFGLPPDVPLEADRRRRR